MPMFEWLLPIDRGLAQPRLVAGAEAGQGNHVRRAFAQKRWALGRDGSTEIPT